MTTKKLIGRLRMELPLYHCSAQGQAVLRQAHPTHGKDKQVRGRTPGDQRPPATQTAQTKNQTAQTKNQTAQTAPPAI